MKIDLTDLSPVKKSMVVEVGPEEVDHETEQVLQRYRQRARIPGFRPGKAPMALIRNRFADEVKEDVRERVVARSYAEATREKGLHPLGNPVVEDLAHEDGQPLRFRTTFEVLPSIQPKGYKNLSVRRPASAVSEPEVEQALEELRKSRTRLVTDPERQAGQGDVVVADIVGAPAGAPPILRERTMIEVGAEDNLPGFNEGLSGASAGDEREIAVKYPSEYPTPELAGQTVDYRVKIHEVKRQEIPELDDAFAKDLGDFDDLGALRARLRQDLEARKARDAQQALRQSLVDKVLLENPIVLPEVLVEVEIRRRLEDLVRGLVLQGIDPEKARLDWQQVRQRQEQPARRAVHARLVLDALAGAESLEVDNAEMERAIREEAQRMGKNYEEVVAGLKKHDKLEALRAQLLREKTLDYLTSVANIQAGE